MLLPQDDATSFSNVRLLQAEYAKRYQAGQYVWLLGAKVPVHLKKRSQKLDSVGTYKIRNYVLVARKLFIEEVLQRI